jgi:hypothetical protein
MRNCSENIGFFNRPQLRTWRQCINRCPKLMGIKKKEKVMESRKTNKRCSYCLHEGSHTGETFLMLQIDLALTSRRHRHLLNDIYSLLPHSRKDVKLDTKTKLYQLNELAELYNCKIMCSSLPPGNSRICICG